MNNTSYSTAGFADRDVEAALDAIAEAGFPQVEVSGRAPHLSEPFTGKTLSEFQDRIYDRGITVRTMHAPSGRTVLGTSDEAWRKQEVELLKSYINFGGELGITDLVVHPIPGPSFVPDGENPAVPALIGDSVKRSLDDLVPVTQSAGIRINLENLPYRCNYPYLTMKELRPLVDNYPEESVGLIIDIGHVGILRNDPTEEITVAGNRLCGTHIHDVVGEKDDGDHRPPTLGWLDWDKILKAFADINYTGPWTFEVIKPVNEQDTPEDLAKFTREVASGWRI